MDETILRGKNILVVDDEVDLREIVASELDYMGAKVFQAGNIIAADAVLKEQKIDLIISDIRMPGGTGVDLLKTVKARNIFLPPMILITGFADITPEGAYAEGAEALLNKPFQLDELIQFSVRLVKPGFEKFSGEVPVAEKTLTLEFSTEVAQTKHFEVGRGGVYLTTDNSKKYDLGEPINLSVKFSDVKIVGVAVPRWSKLSETENRLCLGLELISVSEGLEFLIGHWEKSPGLAFIPKAH